MLPFSLFRPKQFFRLFGCTLLCANIHEAAAQADDSCFQGVEFVGVDLQKQEIGRVLEKFIGQNISQELLCDVKGTVCSFLEKNSPSLVAVEIPEQRVEKGIVTMVAHPVKIGNITFQDNRYFSDQQLRKPLHFQSGSAVSVNQITQDVSWINQNPFRHVEATLTPGKDPYTTDVFFVIKDRFPVRAYVGADNTGNDATMNARMFGGINIGNWAVRDDLLLYQYMMAPNPHRFQSHTINYTSFLPWQHLLIVYGGYSVIHADIPDFTHEGKFGQASLRYGIPLQSYSQPFHGEVSFGFDYKYTNSSLFFSDVPMVSPSLNLTQIFLGYKLNSSFASHQVMFDINAIGSPARMLPNQQNSHFSDLHAGAKNRYFYARVALGDIYTYANGAALSGLLRAQASSGSLVPSEQFGLGGYDTVRGYGERDYLADHGVCFNVELRSRPLLCSTRENQKRGQLTFLTFVDYGFGAVYDRDAGEHQTQVLASIGPGVRYQLIPYVSMRADYGFQLHRLSPTQKSFGKFHLSVTAGY